MLIAGSCHCSNISFTLDWSPEPTRIPARACTCSFCTRHGAVWTSHAGGSLKVALRDPQQVSRYAFATETAHFHVCARCGVVPLVTSVIDGRYYAVVNVNTFDHLEDALLQRSSSSLDGETAVDRLARRKNHWIGDVQFVDAHMAK